ncbi:YveK family protein [Bacillus altitudinis]|uniref:YveK family protein n=1 Tax=Bacillus altitudinis TaxID=293387 RepID=UPI0011A96517|nr:Wzz/FepE/Etk N-terminal domain-containing protein [Bacillus altitudinis]MED4560541.1 Wzz/FepE/Etk N-terminal domain-containing protein [Bacillus altitudinis]
MNENIGFKQLFSVIKEKMALLILIVLIVTGISAYYQFYVSTPVYQATTQILVHKRSSDAQANLNDIQMNLQYTRTFQVLLKSPIVIEKVKETLNLTESAEGLKHKIATSTENESEVINISVQDEDRAKAVAIANTATEVLQEEIKKTMNMDRINVLSEAKLSNTILMNSRKFVHIVLALGASVLGGMTLIFLMNLLDDTVKRTHQIREEIGLPSLGSVYQMQADRRAKKGKQSVITGGQNIDF